MSIEDTLARLPVAMFAGAVGAITFGILGRALAHAGTRGIWVIAIIFCQLATITVGRRLAACLRSGGAVLQHLKLIHILHLAVGMLWAAKICALAVHSDLLTFAVLSTFYAGMIGGAAIALGALCAPAMLLLLPMSAGLAFAWMIEAGPLYGALILSGVCVLDLFIFRFFKDREVRLERWAKANQTIRILLNQFEQEGSDWLWELEATGKIYCPSERLVAALADANLYVGSRKFIDLFREGPARDRLANAIAERASFRNIVVQLADPADERWWRLSGGPDADGCYRGVGCDITHSVMAERTIEFLADHDVLTELPNRRRFYAQAERLTGQDMADCALLLLDLDGFKTINDTHGHAAGDSLLQEIAKRLRTFVDENVTVCRLGGDEFAILITNLAKPEDANSLAYRACSLLRTPIAFDHLAVETTVSVGLAFAEPGLDVTELMRRADVALYKAKDRGRDCLAVYSSDMDNEMLRKVRLSHDLQVAVLEETFELQYHPIIDVATQEMTGMEALLRWTHPELGAISPTEFIPIAEQNGSIGPLGRWVIQRAALAARDLRKDQVVSVNVSKRELESREFVNDLIGACVTAGVSPKKLQIEVTEASLTTDSKSLLLTLSKLQEIGLGIVLDDFGIGRTSIHCLNIFNFDQVKIAPCFVQNLAHNAQQQALVRALIGLAHSLGATIAAEGVETAEQLAVLRREGCDLAQGFFFARPLKLNQATRFSYQADARVKRSA